MGAKFVEIPVEYAELRIKDTGKVFTRLMPEFIGPYTEASVYADNEPYLSFSMFSILFKKQQTRWGHLMTLSDWSPIADVIRKGYVVMYLVTPGCFDDIKLTTNDIMYNPNIDMFEFRGAVAKEKE